MLKKISNKNIIIFLLIILFIFGILEFIKYCQDWNNMIDIAQKVQASNPDMVMDFTKKDTYNVFIDLLRNSNLSILQLIFPIIVIIPAIWNLYNLLKSGIYKDIIIRSDYKKFIKKEMLKCYYPIFIIPIFLIFILFLSYLFSRSWDIDYTFNFILGTSMNFPFRYMHNPNLFLFVYIFNLLLIAIFFINISLIFINKNKNFLLTVLFSFLTIISYQIISEVFVGTLLAIIFDNVIFRNLFSIYNLWLYDGTSLIGVTVYVIILVLVSSVFVYFSFKDKEKVVIDNEK